MHNLQEYDNLAHISEIARRYFAMNAFDGVLTIIGVLIIKSLETGLIHCGVGSYWQKVAIGCVIVVAVWIDRLQRRQKA